MDLLRTIVAAAAGLALASPTLAQKSPAVDGDTLKIEGTYYRLWGIDAPETHQSCADGWPSGGIAASALASLVVGKSIVCEFRAHDRYGREVSLCRADGRDLSADMVRQGMALAFRRYSLDYVALEERARVARVGLFGHDCTETPWDWRARFKR